MNPTKEQMMKMFLSTTAQESEACNPGECRQPACMSVDVLESRLFLKATCAVNPSFDSCNVCYSYVEASVF